MKKVHAALVVLGLVLAVGAAWWLQNRPAAPAGAGAAGNATAGASGASGAVGAAGAAVAVEVGRAERVRLEDDATAVGSVRSNQGVMLRPEVSGRIQRLGFRDGQRVAKGQLLVQLDDVLQRAQLQQAQAQASIARTNLQRNRELVSQNFVSQSVVDQSGANLEVAEAQVALAQAQLQRMKVTAPFDGIAGIRNVNVGDYVKDGADLVQIEDVSSVTVDFPLPERYLPQLKTGQTVTVALDAVPGKTFQARLEAVDSLLDAGGRSLMVRARLVNAGGELRSGMFARARIVFASRDNAVMVPEAALVPMGNQQFLLRVVQAADGTQRAERLVARIGTRRAGRVEVLEGVQPGDLVVVAGQSRAMRADPPPLRIVEAGARSNGAAASGVAAASAPRPGNTP